MSPADTLQAIHRQTTYLQQEIQALLDAQSRGLSVGLGRESDSEDDGSYPKQPLGPIHLPVSSTEGPFSQSSSVQRSRRFSLSTSRKTLYLSLVQLSELKKEESIALELQHETLSNFLANTVKIEDKKTQIEESITKIEAEIDDSDGGLASEEAALVTEIAELQSRLDESVSRLKHVREQRQGSSNRQRARLSSWKGALDGVDQQLRLDVISGRGLEDIIPELRIRKKQDSSGGVWGLSKKRRTIGLIKDDVTEKAEKLLETQQAAELESIACADGAEMWATVVEKVEQIEQALSKEVGKPISNDTTPTEETDAETGMVEIIRAMADTINHLEKELETAETKHWNLLICAIGAELEALKQGKDLLQEALESVQTGSISGTLSMMTAKSRLPSDLKSDDETDHIQDNSLPRNENHEKRTQLVDTSANDIDPELELRKSTSGRPSNEKSPQTRARIHVQVAEDENEDAPGPEFFF